MFGSTARIARRPSCVFAGRSCLLLFLPNQPHLLPGRGTIALNPLLDAIAADDLTAMLAAVRVKVFGFAGWFWHWGGLTHQEGE